MGAMLVFVDFIFQLSFERNKKLYEQKIEQKIILRHVLAYSLTDFNGKYVNENIFNFISFF